MNSSKQTTFSNISAHYDPSNASMHGLMQRLSEMESRELGTNDFLHKFYSEFCDWRAKVDAKLFKENELDSVPLINNSQVNESLTTFARVLPSRFHVEYPEIVTIRYRVGIGFPLLLLYDFNLLRRQALVTNAKTEAIDEDLLRRAAVALMELRKLRQAHVKPGVKPKGFDEPRGPPTPERNGYLRFLRDIWQIFRYKPRYRKKRASDTSRGLIGQPRG